MPSAELFKALLMPSSGDSQDMCGICPEHPVFKTTKDHMAHIRRYHSTPETTLNDRDVNLYSRYGEKAANNSDNSIRSNSSTTSSVSTHFQHSFDKDLSKINSNQYSDSNKDLDIGKSTLFDAQISSSTRAESEARFRESSERIMAHLDNLTSQTSLFNTSTQLFQSKTSSSYDPPTKKEQSSVLDNVKRSDRVQTSNSIQGLNSRMESVEKQIKYIDTLKMDVLSFKSELNNLERKSLDGKFKIEKDLETKGNKIKGLEANIKELHDQMSVMSMTMKALISNDRKDTDSKQVDASNAQLPSNTGRNCYIPGARNYRDEVIHLKTKLQEKTEEITKLSEELSSKKLEYEEQKSSQEEKINLLAEEILEKDELNSTLAEKIEDLAEKILSFEQRDIDMMKQRDLEMNEKMEAVLKTKSDVIKKLLEERDEMTTSCQTMFERMDEQHNLLREQIELLETTNKEADERHNDDQATIDDLRSTIKGAIERLKQAHEELENKSNIIDQLNENVQTKSDKIETLQKETDSKDDEIRDLEERLRESDVQINRLNGVEDALEKKKSELVKLRKEFDDERMNEKTARNELDREIKTLVSTIDDKQLEIDSLMWQTNMMKGDLNGKDSHISSLEEALSTKSEKESYNFNVITSLKDDLNKRNKEISTLREELDEVKNRSSSDVERLEIELTATKVDSERYKTRVEELENLLKEAKAEAEEYANERDALKYDCNAHNEDPLATVNIESTTQIVLLDVQEEDLAALTASLGGEELLKQLTGTTTTGGYIESDFSDTSSIEEYKDCESSYSESENGDMEESNDSLVVVFDDNYPTPSKQSFDFESDSDESLPSKSILESVVPNTKNEKDILDTPSTSNATNNNVVEITDMIAQAETNISDVPPTQGPLIPKVGDTLDIASSSYDAVNGESYAEISDSKGNSFEYDPVETSDLDDTSGEGKSDNTVKSMLDSKYSSYGTMEHSVVPAKFEDAVLSANGPAYNDEGDGMAGYESDFSETSDDEDSDDESSDSDQEDGNNSSTVVFDDKFSNKDVDLRSFNSIEDHIAECRSDIVDKNSTQGLFTPKVDTTILGKSSINETMESESFAVVPSKSSMNNHESNEPTDTSDDDTAGVLVGAASAHGMLDESNFYESNGNNIANDDHGPNKPGDTSYEDTAGQYVGAAATARGMLDESNFYESNSNNVTNDDHGSNEPTDTSYTEDTAGLLVGAAARGMLDESTIYELYSNYDANDDHGYDVPADTSYTNDTAGQLVRASARDMLDNQSNLYESNGNNVANDDHQGVLRANSFLDIHDKSSTFNFNASASDADSDAESVEEEFSDFGDDEINFILENL